MTWLPDILRDVGSAREPNMQSITLIPCVANLVVAHALSALYSIMTNIAVPQEVILKQSFERPKAKNEDTKELTSVVV